MGSRGPSYAPTHLHSTCQPGCYTKVNPKPFPVSHPFAIVPAVHASSTAYSVAESAESYPTFNCKRLQDQAHGLAGLCFSVFSRHVWQTSTPLTCTNGARSTRSSDTSGRPFLWIRCHWSCRSYPCHGACQTERCKASPSSPDTSCASCSSPRFFPLNSVCCAYFGSAKSFSDGETTGVVIAKARRDPGACETPSLTTPGVGESGCHRGAHNGTTATTFAQKRQ